MTMIHIDNLPENADEKHLRRLMVAYGDVISMQIISPDSGHRFDDFALIELEKTSAEKAISELDGKVFEGAIIRVQKATESQQHLAKPRLVQLKEKQSTPQAFRRPHYEVTAVEKVAAPNGAEGDDWYRYELSHGSSKISGFHRGTLEEVTQFASESGATINERSLSGKSRHPYRPQQKK